MAGFQRWLETPAGRVPVISPALGPADRFGAWKARWGIGRMSYLVPPGLYAVGSPTPDDPVLVTANYKMSYDLVRSELAGRNVWLLVLETNGINVWCAAGKGTFGTGELVARIEASRLAQVVGHRRLILPLLGAPGVSAHEVRSRTGFLGALCRDPGRGHSPLSRRRDALDARDARVELHASASAWFSSRSSW